MSGFSWESPQCPSAQHVVERKVAVMEGFSGCKDAKVICPSPDDGAELFNDGLLRGCLKCSNCFVDLPIVSLDGFFTGCDDCSETKQFCGPGCPRRFRLSCRVLPYVKTQEVESHIALMGRQRVCDSGLARLHFQALQPFFYHLPYLENPFQ